MMAFVSFIIGCILALFGVKVNLNVHEESGNYPDDMGD